MHTTTNPPRLGVEEEFLVIDPTTGTVTPQAPAIINRATGHLGPRISGEITPLHIETRTNPTTSTTQLLHELLDARHTLADAATAEGLHVIPTGTPIHPGAVPPPVTPGPRQDHGTATYRGLHDELAICAVHIHVELPDREHAVLVSNHLRPHLPLLIALTANSPHWEGRDTGYASWRTMTWNRWPIAGPPPRFTSLDHYHHTIDTLTTTGALVDPATLFWDIRPSPTHPTIEIRAADVPVTATESATLAALVRALVTTASHAVHHGDHGPTTPTEILRAAYWRAARDGLDGHLLDPHTHQLRPAHHLLHDLLHQLTPTLHAHDDHHLVTTTLRHLTTTGTGATRQRTAARRRGHLTDVTTYLATHLTATHPHH
ncbi:carboxylate-amine ligase [Micromonospora cathayae]|uniref:Putative glutamate--cysteine ligase 2 n=1 Tax=Micromonospora cathayae TaxID=3028804 RepID=A0ABY7ZJM0_9ACTN|nr:glutamate--cysteine ligase [Micromonospora sp. HUAS 3]WDZ83151.1 glutamate--cysteine ligase [Micromonospora sp. HUAS 3]